MFKKAFAIFFCLFREKTARELREQKKWEFGLKVKSKDGKK